jgi:hypothetical protein
VKRILPSIAINEFEQYDPNHTDRSAIKSLDSIEEVRIIKGALK